MQADFRIVPRWLLWALWAMALPALAQADTANLPVAPPANAQMAQHSDQGFVTYPLIVKRIVQIGGIKGNIAATQTVEGALTRRTYRVAGQQTAAAVSVDYTQRLNAAGFKVLFHCKGDGCGPTFVRASPGFRADPDLFGSGATNQHYLAARRSAADGDVYVAVQTAPLSGGDVALQVDRLKVKPREVGAISVSATEMARQIHDRGRAVLYGIYFDVNSARLKPESKPTLAQIAQLLKNKPKLRLLVVGHTDNRGSFEYNIDLSKRRAEAVVDALVKQYGIDRDRLKPWGVGYSAPRASNTSDVGRAKNRRVELVPW